MEYRVIPSRRALFALLVLSATPLHAAAQQAGRLVIVGGGLARDTESVFRAVLDARHGTGPLCVIPTASADIDAAISSSIERFDYYGGAGVTSGVLLSVENAAAARDPNLVAQIRGCSGFWFTGGVQSRIVHALRPDGARTPAFDALFQRYAEGAVVGGSSAGAAIMSDPMIAGGSTTGAIAYGVRRSAGTLEDGNDGQAGGGIDVMAGGGFLRSAIVDQHFLARGRIGRLVTAVLDLEEFDLGYGIDENTALVVDDDAVYALGESGVIVIDARGAQRDGRSATGLRLHLLGVGDRFDSKARHLVIGSGKRPLPRVLGTVTVPDDVFARWQFLHLLERFSRSDERQISLAVPGGELVLRKGDDFTAHSADGAGVQGTRAALSITGLLLDVLR
jgi:cyanophycinase